MIIWTILLLALTSIGGSQTTSEECPEGFVQCVDGKTADGSQTCQEACGGK